MGFKVGGSAGDIGGDLKDIFMTEYDLINNYTGNQIWGWGFNAQGGLGDTTNTPRSSPIQVIGSATNWRQVSAGNYGGGGIKTDGTLWMWGTGYWGTLGNNLIGANYSPVQTISGGTNWKQLSAGRTITSAIKTDGTLWTWGVNCTGNLGTNNGITIHQSSPVQTISGGTNWRCVSAGAHGSHALKTDGTIWGWGCNCSGNLGNNNTIDQSSPVQTLAGGTNWQIIPPKNYFNSAGIKTDGTLWIWGRNNIGQLGNNTTINASSPIQTISGGTNWKTVSVGICHTTAIKTDGSLWTWGENNYGMLGNNTTIHTSSPVQTISGGTNWKVGIAGRCTNSGIKTDGSLWVWGRNQAGQLGNGSSIHASSPVQTIAAGSNWRSISPGGCISLALRLFNGYNF